MVRQNHRIVGSEILKSNATKKRAPIDRDRNLFARLSTDRKVGVQIGVQIGLARNEDVSEWHLTIHYNLLWSNNPESPNQHNPDKKIIRQTLFRALQMILQVLESNSSGLLFRRILSEETAARKITLKMSKWVTTGAMTCDFGLTKLKVYLGIILVQF